MENYGFRGLAKNFFTSYFENRMQCVIYNDTKSDFRNINISVPKVMFWVLYFLIYF